MSIENLDPITVYDLKRNRSPKTNPTSPESDNQNQFSTLASVGNKIFLLNRLRILRKINPIASLRIFTATEPSLLLADSNASALTVQKKAVSSAANSPIWFSIKSI